MLDYNIILKDIIIKHQEIKIFTLNYGICFATVKIKLSPDYITCITKKKCDK